jgi:hypothetical protein
MDVFVLDILLLFIGFVYLIDRLIGMKTYVTRVDKYVLYIPAIALLSVISIYYRGDINFLRAKTAFSGFCMLLLFCGCIYLFSNMFRNGDLLVTVSKYLYYFCFIDFLYITASLMVLGSSRETRIIPLIEGFFPFKESVLYVYGYILSRCLINRRWNIIDVLILISSSIVNFAMFYRSLTLIWIVMTISLIMLHTKDKIKILRTVGIISMVVFLVIILFSSSAEKEINLMLDKTHDEISNIPTLMEVDYEFDEVTAFTDEYGASRIFVWLQAVPYIMSSPFIGNGIGYEAYLGAEKEIVEIYSQSRHYVATFHNQLISFVIDYGIIGTFFIYLVFIKIGVLGLKIGIDKDISNRSKHAAYSFIVIYIVYFINSLFGWDMIPSHPNITNVIPLWLFMAAIISEYKYKYILRNEHRTFNK